MCSFSEFIGICSSCGSNWIGSEDPMFRVTSSMRFSSITVPTALWWVWYELLHSTIQQNSIHWPFGRQNDKKTVNNQPKSHSKWKRDEFAYLHPPYLAACRNLVFEHDDSNCGELRGVQQTRNSISFPVQLSFSRWTFVPWVVSACPAHHTPFSSSPCCSDRFCAVPFSLSSLLRRRTHIRSSIFA